MGDGNLPYEVIRGTAAAVLIDFGDREEWIPRSQLLDGSETDFADGTEATVIIPTWLAVAKGLAE